MTAAWHRRDLGWLRADGEVFLERGAPMSDTGHPAWLVWVRALPSEITVETVPTTGTSYAYATNSDPARRLSDCLAERFDADEDDPWFIHRGDEGWLADAKVAADYHVARRNERAGDT